MTFFLPPVVQIMPRRSTLFALLRSKCYCYIWHVFADICLAGVCFMNMLNCKWSSLRARHFAGFFHFYRIPLWEGFKLSARLFLDFKPCLLAVNWWVALAGGGFSSLAPSSCVWICCQDLMIWLALTPEKWSVWYMSCTHPPRCFSLYAMLLYLISGCSQIAFPLIFFCRLILHLLREENAPFAIDRTVRF